MNQFCEMKGIKREFSVARTPQQNGVAKRKNKTLIEAARTMLADSKLPTTFWAEAVNTACYVQNRVLVIKPYNKTPYELFLGRKLALSFMRLFGCPVTILNTIDQPGHNTPNIARSGPNWLFDIDALTNSMNYKPIIAGNQSNGNAGIRSINDAKGLQEKRLKNEGTLSVKYKQNHKGQPKLGLWYPKDSPFDLVAYTNSDYAGASLDRKSTIGAEYIAASNCCGQVLWIQNQLLDYGYNFMQTKIHIDNESTICIVKNPIFHSKTKHIKIMHHFIRDSNEKKLIQMIKIHTDQNVTDLLTKAFDVSRFQYLMQVLECLTSEVLNEGSTAGRKLVLLGKKNADFAEIVDFLNANPIRYALTVSPTIYVSCIEQFWSTAKTKTVNNETQIHVKVEGKTIVISESSMRRDLQFDDEDGIACLTNTESFENLQLMGYEKLSEKLTFYKPYFSPQWKQGKDFSGTVTPLFSSMLEQQADIGEGLGHPTNPQHTSTFAQPSNEEQITAPSSSQPKKTYKRRKPKKVTEIHQSSELTNLVADKAVHEERGDSVERAATTATSLDAEQDSGGRPRRQETMGDRPAQTRFESLSKQSYDSPLGGVNTPRSDEDKIELKELMEICTQLSKEVLDLETTKTAQVKEIANLKKRVKKLERKRKSRTPGMNLFKIDEVPTSDAVNIAGTEFSTASAPVTTAGVSVSTAEPITTASEVVTIVEQNEIGIKGKQGVTCKNLVRLLSKTNIHLQHDPKDKGKAKMVEPKKPLKRKAQIKEEDANIIECDDVQAMMNADYELAARLQEQEQGELTIEERSKMFVELMDKRKKHFARLRAEKQRRKPLTKAQRRNQMCTYLKNMAGFTHNQLKNKNFEEIQKAFNKTMNWINSFVPMDYEMVEGNKDKAEGSKKSTREELDEESVKRQKLEDDAKKAELKLCLEIVPYDDKAVNFEPLATKSPIVNWKT
ncbi:putative ribonuclease H-like domain-containing protein [Tanacetum coccineum]